MPCGALPGGGSPCRRMRGATASQPVLFHYRAGSQPLRGVPRAREPMPPSCATAGANPFSEALAMPRLSLPAVLAGSLIATIVVLFGWSGGLWGGRSHNPGGPPSTATAQAPSPQRTAASGQQATGEAAGGPPATSARVPPAQTSQAPAGTPSPGSRPEPNPVPPSALPTASSGAPAAPAGRSGEAAQTAPVPGSTAHVPPQTPAAPVEAAPGHPVPPAAQGGTAAAGTQQPPNAQGAPVTDLRTGAPVAPQGNDDGGGESGGAAPAGPPPRP